MKKIVTSLAAVGMLLGTAASAVAAPAPVDRDPSVSAEGEEFRGRGSGWIVALIAALVAAGIVFLIEDREDEDLPTSP